ncbi:MAG: hypothetical protein L0H84_06185 [Pseudonocardia sp.]|nr:hypothetical protein [Pseudonocardia sp.]
MADEMFAPSTLHVKPESISAVRAAIQESLNELSPALVQLQRDGVMTRPWLNEPVSIAAMNHYNQTVMRSPTGLYHGLLAYERQLKDAIVALDEAARRYARHEDDQTALVLRLGPQARA